MATTPLKLYWEERKQRRYSNFTPLEEAAEAAIRQLQEKLFISEQAYHRLDIQYIIATGGDPSNELQDMEELGYTLDLHTADLVRRWEEKCAP
jgi:hypothetical protein